jgi:hypothetical protein
MIDSIVKHLRETVMPDGLNVVWGLPKRGGDILGPDDIFGEPRNDVVGLVPSREWNQLVRSVASITGFGKAPFAGQFLQVLVCRLARDFKMFGGFLRYGAWMLFDIVDDESSDDFSLLTYPSIQGLAGSLSTFMIHIVNFNGRIVNPKLRMIGSLRVNTAKMPGATFHVDFT